MGFFDKFFNTKKQLPNSEIVPVSNNLKVYKSSDLELVEVLPRLELPKILENHKSDFEKTKTSFIAINATLAQDLSLEESKFGYYPFIPLNFDYPKDSLDEFMYPLAQINCKDIPELLGYPTSGYLQFYISGFDDYMGVDFDNLQSQKNFRVLYFEEGEIQEYKADFSFLDKVMASDCLPLNKPYKLQFELKEEYIGLGDARYEESPYNINQIISQFPDIEDELSDAVYDNCSNNGHKMGGYAFFTQEDPRLYNETLKAYILLLQIDSDNDIIWGDCGVANFFIDREDLAKKDFSKVLFTWDCC